MSVLSNNNIVDAAHRFEAGAAGHDQETNKGPEGRGPALERHRILQIALGLAEEAVRAQTPELVEGAPSAAAASQLAQVVRLAVEPTDNNPSAEPVDELTENFDAIGYQQDDTEQSPTFVENEAA